MADTERADGAESGRRSAALGGDDGDGSAAGARDAARLQRPRDAATLVLVDFEADVAKVLMGRRRAGQVFMPNKVVFPGGRVDEADRDVAMGDPLADCETEKLLLEMKGRPSATRARSLALAAVRETFEETGVIVGRARDGSAGDGGPVPPSWQAFHAAGYAPRLSGLSFFARAITPPGRPRRYDTRFFCASARLIAAETGQSDEELSSVGWYTIEETRSLDLPPITRVILEELGDRLKTGPLGPLAHPVPFYHQRRGTFVRELLMPAGL